MPGLRPACAAGPQASTAAAATTPLPPWKLIARACAASWRGRTSSRPWPPSTSLLPTWAAAAWGGLISLSKDDPDTVADLPAAIRLAQLAWAGNPAYGDGALASLMGSFEAARPGGSRQQAEAYFDEALRLGAGRNAGAFVAKAEGIAQPAGDKAAFLALLKQAVAVRDAPGSPSTLANEVMRRRAEWLIQTADDLF
jgi:hypothetical protein